MAVSPGIVFISFTRVDSSRSRPHTYVGKIIGNRFVPRHEVLLPAARLAVLRRIAHAIDYHVWELALRKKATYLRSHIKKRSSCVLRPAAMLAQLSACSKFSIGIYDDPSSFEPLFQY